MRFRGYAPCPQVISIEAINPARIITRESYRISHTPPPRDAVQGEQVRAVEKLASIEHVGEICSEVRNLSRSLFREKSLIKTGSRWKWAMSATVTSARRANFHAPGRCSAGGAN